jgi:hypothetical protein
MPTHNRELRQEFETWHSGSEGFPPEAGAVMPDKLTHTLDSSNDARSWQVNPDASLTID